MVKRANRVQETSTTTGTGTMTLAGAVSKYRSFSSSFSVGDSIYYTIEDITSTDWEVGAGTLLSATTFSRDQVFSSSNAGALVVFTTGTRNVWCTDPAENQWPVVKNSTAAVEVCTVPVGSQMLVVNTFDNLWTIDVLGQLEIIDAPPNKAFAAPGANSDITSLSGLTTPLSIAQGGTGNLLGGSLVSNGLVAYGTSTTLTTADLGRAAYYNGSAGTLTLPAAASCPVGTIISIANISPSICTIARTGTSLIYALGQQAVISISLGLGDSVQLTNDGVNWVQVTGTSGLGSLVQNALTGLTLSTAGASATLSIAAGQAANSTNTAMMTLAATMAKTTAAWAVGSTNGGLDTGTIAAGAFYSWYLIRRPDTGVVDVVYSLSSTAPTLPTNYTQFRRLGTIQTTAGSQWSSFIQSGDLFQLLTPIADVSVANPGIAAVTRSLSVPSAPDIIANIRVSIQNAVATTSTYSIFSDLATTDIGPGASLTDSPSVANAVGSVLAAGFRLSIRTNGSAQIRSRLSYSDVNSVLTIYTAGWTDTRGK